MSIGKPSMGLGSVEPRSCVAPFPVEKCSGPKRMTKHDGAGYGTLLTIVRFTAWSHEQMHFPMPEQVIARFNCSRATAHRWLNALADCYGIDRPRRDAYGNIKNAA